MKIINIICNVFNNGESTHVLSPQEDKIAKVVLAIFNILLLVSATAATITATIAFVKAGQILTAAFVATALGILILLHIKRSLSQNPLTKQSTNQNDQNNQKLVDELKKKDEAIEKQKNEIDNLQNQLKNRNIEQINKKNDVSESKGIFITGEYSDPIFPQIINSEFYKKINIQPEKVTFESVTQIKTSSIVIYYQRSGLRDEYKYLSKLCKLGHKIILVVGSCDGRFDVFSLQNLLEKHSLISIVGMTVIENTLKRPYQYSLNKISYQFSGNFDDKEFQQKNSDKNAQLELIFKKALELANQ